MSSNPKTELQIKQYQRYRDKFISVRDFDYHHVWLNEGDEIKHVDGSSNEQKVFWIYENNVVKKCDWYHHWEILTGFDRFNECQMYDCDKRGIDGAHVYRVVNGITDKSTMYLIITCKDCNRNKYDIGSKHNGFDGPVKSTLACSIPSYKYPI